MKILNELKEKWLLDEFFSNQSLMNDEIQNKVIKVKKHPVVGTKSSIFRHKLLSMLIQFCFFSVMYFYAYNARGQYGAIWKKGKICCRFLRNENLKCYLINCVGLGFDCRFIIIIYMWVKRRLFARDTFCSDWRNKFKFIRPKEQWVIFQLNWWLLNTINIDRDTHLYSIQSIYLATH